MKVIEMEYFFEPVELSLTTPFLTKNGYLISICIDIHFKWIFIQMDTNIYQQKIECIN